MRPWPVAGLGLSALVGLGRAYARAFLRGASVGFVAGLFL